MKRIRIGNDINVAWSILQKDGTPFSLEARDVKVFLRTPFGKQDVSDYTINNNVIEWTFLGRSQKVQGYYSLILVINEGNRGMVTTDTCNFVELVPCSCQVGGQDNDGVQTEAIELTSTLGFIAYDDTEIREELSRLETDKADKSELTELSEEVSGLSEKIENLPSGESDVFKAIYGETKIEEIIDAYESGKVVHCDYQNNCYILSRVFSGEAYFTAVYANISYLIVCNKNSVWNGSNFRLEESINKVTSLSSSSTNTQYPSAKAVYDALQNVGGSSVFEAVYNTTTYEEIVAAYNAGKWVVCAYENRNYHLSSIESSNAFFATAEANTNHRVWVNTSNKWYKASYVMLTTGDKVTTIDESSVDTKVPSAKAVYNAIQQSGTPSGDPMHYMFEAAGATYNATDEDIPMVGVYGDSYVHKARHWHLNELGDITNEEMRVIYAERYPFKANITLNNLFTTTPLRTIICNAAVSASGHTENYFLYESHNIETLFYAGTITRVLLTSLIGWVYNCKKLKKIINEISLQYVTSSGALGNAFLKCSSLAYVRLFNLSQSISFNDSPLLSESSILYMIKNEAAKSAIVITLHADAYARAMADAEIQAALEAHPNVSLASA